MNLDLKQHVVVVTGGASGIGRAVAEAFLDEQANVAIWDVVANVASVAAELDQRGAARAIGTQVDVTEAASVHSAHEKCLAELGPIDHLVHCAAIGSGKFGIPFTNLEPADWPRVLDVNIMGMVHMAHELGPSMAERRSGTMVFIASVAGQIGSPTDPPYSASKAANINFAQCLAKDLAAAGVRVNTVCPGMVKTPLNQAVWQAWNDRQPAAQQRSYDEWATEKIRSVVPLNEWQTPQDVADMAVFLSSQRARQVTGQTINVDGGFVMHS